MEPRDERLDNHPLHLAAHPAPDYSSLRLITTNEEPEFPPTESPMSSPQSESVTKSPEVQPDFGSTRGLSPGVEADPTPSPDVAQRRVSAVGPRSAGTEKEKRKRSRVTPDQLVHLERFFSMDRSPTAARRREISELLGMQERQTQIWFQNRRAKAKLLNGKGKRTDSTPPTTPPDLLPGYDADLHSLIHENEPVTIIPCTDLTIGTWRRMASQVSKHDLIAYVCESRSCLIWFIHSSGYGFKMEIPFHIIVETEFVNAAPASGLASFFLSQPPLFYLEDIMTNPAGGAPVRSWKRCADWTEGMQATKILRHDLVGSAVQLAYVLRNFHTTSGSDIRLRCPPYVRSELASPHSVDPNSSVPLPPGLTGSEHQNYRPPFGGGTIDSGRDGLGGVPKRYSFPSAHVPLSAPSDATAYGGDALGAPSHPHLTLTDDSSSSPQNTFSSFPLSAPSTSTSYSTVSLYPIEVPVQRPQSHLGNYAQVSPAAGHSPYLGQGQGFAIPAPPASAPPSHSHFELAPTPPQQSSLAHAQQQSYHRHQTTQLLGPPAVPVLLPFGNGFDANGQRGEQEAGAPLPGLR
ncbi:hypothetical protein BC827DRAFT_553262 [Russula dissimulans]|nr:hypothetical protein BC827DRAFT_553262 [Russula dissimulans]